MRAGVHDYMFITRAKSFQLKTYQLLLLNQIKLFILLSYKRPPLRAAHVAMMRRSLRTRKDLC